MKSIAKLLISLAICFTCDPLHVSAQENIPDEGDTTTETPSPEKIEEQWAEELIYRANTVQLSADKSTLRYPVMEQKRVSTTGTWTWRDGVICVTDSYASVDWFNNGHAGIVAAAPYYRATIEANPSLWGKIIRAAPVRIKPWNLTRSNESSSSSVILKDRWLRSSLPSKSVFDARPR